MTDYTELRQKQVDVMERVTYAEHESDCHVYEIAETVSLAAELEICTCIVAELADASATIIALLDDLEAAHKAMAQFDELVAIQCSNGNWNFDPYMHGMANGMLLAQAHLKGEGPKFLEAPEKWLSEAALAAGTEASDD